MLIRCRVVAACLFLFCAVMGARAQVVLTEPVGTTSPVQTATLTVTAAGTIGAINVLTKGAPNLDFNFVSGGTCSVGMTYSANAICTVEYTFKPTAPGTRYGGITLTTSSGALLGNAYIYGAGTGPQVNWRPGQQLALGTGLSNPNGVAVDGNGNTYVAENGNVVEIAATGAVTKFPFSGDMTDVAVDGSGNVFAVNDLYIYGAVVNEIVAVNGNIPAPVIRTIAPGFATLHGIAVDGNGDLFLTQSYSTGTECAIYEIPAVDGIIPVAPTVLTLATSFGASTCGPTGVAVDTSGDLFVADPRAGAVYELLAVNGAIPASPTIRTLGSGFKEPGNIALDGVGDAFIADYANSAVYELLAVNGSIPASPTIRTLGSGFVSPTGVTVDGSGNVFVSDVGLTHIVKLDFADPPSLSFVTTPVGQISTDSPKTVTLSNSGNAPLTFSTPGAGINPGISAGFTLGNSSTCPQLSASAAPATLAVDASCTDVVSFHPVAQGTISGQLATTDNALNVAGATQVIPLGGTGTPATTISTLTVSPNPVPVGAAVTLTANVAPNPASANVPTGTVTFYNGAVNIGVAALNGSAVATLTTSALPAGTDNLSCVYSGDSNFAGSNCAAVPLDVTVPQTIVFPAPPSPAYAGTSVLLTATASSGLPVTYSVINGPADVSGSVLHYNGAGTVVVQAQQAGNVTYSAAASVQDSVSTTLLSVPVGTQSAVVTTTVTIGKAGVLSAIQVFTQGAANLDFNLAAGGTCLAGTAYTAGQTCNVTFTFTPTHPGLRFGGISLSTNGAVVLGNAYAYGLGTGPQVIYSPAAQSLLGGYYSYPTGVAVDAAADVFLSDENANGVFEITNGVSRQIGATFSTPDDVAVDGSGNVFVIYNRTSLAEIQAVNGVIPNAPAVNVIATNFSGLNGMKVDGNGNIYLAEGFSSNTGNMIQEVLAVNGSIPANPTVLTLVSGVGEPTGVAVDAAGDVFFSDQTGSVYEALAVNGVVPANPTLVTVTSGINTPTNIALDAAGNVFVTKSAGVVEIEASNGTVPANPTIVTWGTNLVFPQGLAVDASGNIFVADGGGQQAVKLDFADAPMLTFATTQVGSTSTDSPQTVSLDNDGNANLVWTSIPATTNPTITAGYTFTSTCAVINSISTLSGAMPPGGSCAESISFTPVSVGPDPGEWTLIDNNLYVSSAKTNILLNGTGTSDATTLTLTSSVNPAYVLQPITITVQLNGANGNGIGGQTINLSYTVLGTPYNVPLFTNSSGSASFTLSNGLPAASTTFNAAFAATATQQASSASLIEVVNLNPTMSVLSVSPNPPVVNNAVTLTATVTSATTSSALAGTVNFYNGGTLLGSGTVSNGSATMQTSTLPLGPVTVSCTFLANGVFAASSCPPIMFTVQLPPDFSLSATPPSITIETQHHGTMPLTLTSIGPFAGPVTLACQGPLPPYVTCELPASETLSAGQTLNFNFTMDTDQILNFLAKGSPAREANESAAKRIALALLLPLALMGFVRRRKAVWRVMLLIVLTVGASALMACSTKWPQHTPPGVYTIPVLGTGTTANGTVITHTLNITLTVTP